MTRPTLHTEVWSDSGSLSAADNDKVLCRGQLAPVCQWNQRPPARTDLHA